MENKNRNIAFSILFLVIVIGLIIVGTFYVQKLRIKKDDGKPVKQYSESSSKLDSNQAYIYFENEVEQSKDPDLLYKDVVINFKGAELLNDVLKAEMDQIRAGVVLFDETKIDPNQVKIFENSDIYEAPIRYYEVYQSPQIVSLVIIDSLFNAYHNFAVQAVQSFNLNLDQKIIMSDEDLLSKFDVSQDDISFQVANQIDETQSQIDNIEVIKKEETLAQLTSNSALYISNGNLYLTYVVKTNFVDYNENVKLK